MVNKLVATILHDFKLKDCQLANQLEVSQSAITRYLAGTCDMKLQNFKKLNEIYPQYCKKYLRGEYD
jgi:predicted transcriptional regulator